MIKTIAELNAVKEKAADVLSEKTSVLIVGTGGAGKAAGAAAIQGDLPFLTRYMAAVHSTIIARIWLVEAK